MAEQERQVAQYFEISPSDRHAFERDGFVCLRGVLSELEMQQHVDAVYYKFLKGQVNVPGKDLCDMSVRQPSLPYLHQLPH